MLHYIINSSIIWLAFLILYQFFLRKESFHQISRIYLLVAVCAGLVLPKIDLSSLAKENKTSFIYSSNRVAEIKHTYMLNPVENISTPLTNTDNYLEVGLWSLYLLGVLIGLVVLFNEIKYLIRLFRYGKKSSELGCKIVETNVTHCPFSLFNYIFISSKDDYTHSEWKLVLEHEHEHAKQYHTLDNIVLIVFRIVFWFNPLSHIYFKKLRIVHEFQADKVGAGNITKYGSFLIDLNLLHGAPILTHSFNYSPIKLRIAMLKQSKSTRIKLLKYLIVLPLMVGLSIFCTQTSFSGDLGSSGKKARYKDNTIEYGEFKVIPYENRKELNKLNTMFLNTSIPDSLPVYDYATGQLIRMEKLLVEKVPVKINNKPIYGSEPQFLIPKFDADYKLPVINAAKNLDEYLFIHLKNELARLEDGRYELRLNNLVIDDKGHIAFFDLATLDPYISPDDKTFIYTDDSRQAIDKKLSEILLGPIQFKPATRNGRPINVRYSLGSYLISVKNQQAKLIDRPGC